MWESCFVDPAPPDQRGLSAEEYGVEILGILRVPLYTRPRNRWLVGWCNGGMVEFTVYHRGGFPEFLKNNFAGNARENLLLALRVSLTFTQY